MKKIMFLMAMVIGFFTVSNANAQKISTYKYERGHVLKAGQTLNPGEGLRGINKTFSLVMQADGNLCLYSMRDKKETPTYCSNTLGSGHHLTMQTDGNLVLFNKDGKAIWSSGTNKGTADEKGVAFFVDDFTGRAVMANNKNKVFYDWKTGLVK